MATRLFNKTDSSGESRSIIALPSFMLFVIQNFMMAFIEI